jgi:NAD(P)-dependent dehydrogenase (short-subunit alcohol dehydrogenase family)
MKSKIALVTGAAKGIGRATAVAFARKGVNIVLSDLDKNQMKHTAKMVEAEGVEVLQLETDVSNLEDVRQMVEHTLEKFGRLDIACNNAGIGGSSANTADYDIEEWDKVLHVNLRGQFFCMKFELEAMLKQESGSIINVSSILGKVGFRQAPAYTAAKHGLIGLTKTAALEYAEEGIRVNAVCPGFIDTPMLTEAGIMDDPETKDHIISLHPAGRFGRPKEVADAIVWLSSDEASFVTGHSMLVDGGFTTQ